MTINVKATDNSIKVQIKKILLPIDGSEYSFNAPRYTIKIAKDEDAELFCIYVITSVQYWYPNFPPAINQYFKDLEQEVQSWFDEIRDTAKKEGIPALKTEILSDVKSLIGSIIDYATTMVYVVTAIKVAQQIFLCSKIRRFPTQNSKHKRS